MPERGAHSQAIEITNANAKPLIRTPSAPHSEPAQIVSAKAMLTPIMIRTNACGCFMASSFFSVAAAALEGLRLGRSLAARKT